MVLVTETGFREKREKKWIRVGEGCGVDWSHWKEGGSKKGGLSLLHYFFSYQFCHFYVVFSFGLMTEKREKEDSGSVWMRN